MATNYKYFLMLAIALLLLVLVVFIRQSEIKAFGTCSFAPAWGGVFKRCTCLGIEKCSSNPGIADVDGKCICVGIITDHVCYELESIKTTEGVRIVGEIEVECPERLLN